MEILEDLKQAMANSSVTLEDVNTAMCEGIKQHYGVDDLKFFNGFDLGMAGLFGGIVRDQWLCSTKEYKYGTPVIIPCDLKKLLERLSKGQTSIYFIDLDKRYSTLHDLKHDKLAMQLSGIKI